MKKRTLSLLLALVMVLGMFPMSAMAAEGLTVTDNVIDIADLTVYEEKYIATAMVTGIKIAGADVEKATQDNNTSVEIVLSGSTAPDAEISIEFVHSGSNYKMSGHTAAVKLADGKAQLVMTLKGEYKYTDRYSGTKTYTLNFSLGAPPTDSPTRLQASVSASAYTGVAVDFDLKEYFTGAKTYYLVDGEEKTLLDSSTYTFKSFTVGTHTLVFAAANDVGFCPDYVTATVEVTEIKCGAWLGIEKSNGSVNYVLFKDADGNEINGLTASLDGNAIQVSVPRSYAPDGKITAKFDLTQNESGLPFITTKTGTSGTSSGKAVSNKFTEKTITLSGGNATFAFYLYNSVPSTNNNNYTTYTLNFAIQNEAPVLAGDASTQKTITAGETYALDLDGLFADPDDGDSITGWKVSIDGAAATNAAVDENNVYSWTTDTAGEYVLKFYAIDKYNAVSAEAYTVTLTVENTKDTYSMTVSVPAGLEPEFYVSTGFTDGIDQLGAAVDAIAGETTDGMTAYTLAYPQNATMLSIRDDNWGGMAFAAVKDGSISFRKMQFSVVDYDNNPAESTNTAIYGENKAVAGSDGLLLVSGTDYMVTAAPKDTANFANVSKTMTLEAGADVYVLEMMLNLKNPLTITVTTGAKAQLYKYNKYYDSTEFDAKIIKDNGDGTTTYTFIADTKSGSFMYRVSMEGKIAKAGWLTWNQQSLTVLHGENDKANTWRLDDYGATGQQNSGVAEDSVLLNINSRNHLNLSVGQTKTLKAYRAWEIIQTSSDNKILTPDFTYTILDGNDVVSLTEKASLSTADGDWMTLTALQEGTAIIEVTYDALEAIGGGPAGAYGASDPTRTGLVVVTVGGGDESVNFGIDCFASIGSKGSANTTFNPNNKKAWDAEFDTLYFTGDSREIQFTPTASGEIQSVAVSNDKGATWTTLTAAEGVYTATIVPGNNILRVMTAAGTAYQIVRGDKVEVRLAEVSGASDEDGIIEAGETVRVILKGLHTPIPKMAGNYNPGFGGNNDGYSYQHLNYICNDELIYGPGAQYNFITAANYVEIEIPQDGSDVALTDGYIGVGVIGLTQFADGGDSHRNIPDNGCTTRGSMSTWHTRSILPEITVTIGGEAAPNTPPAVRDNAPTTASLALSESVYTYAINLATEIFADADTEDVLTYTVKVNDEAEHPVENGYYTLVRPEVGAYTLLFTVSDGEASAAHTITLTVTKAEAPDPDPAPGGGGGNEDEQIVYISFVDFAARVEGESGVDYPNQLGTIVPTTAVSFTQGDTIADVTLRLLDSKGMTYQYTGTPKSGFYLSKIGNFSANGIPVDEFGEFDAGNGSGWMITQNGTFIGQGASEFLVKDGDVIEWKYTCRLGADIGDPFWDDKEYGGSVNGDQDETALNFTDISEKDYYFDAVKWAVEKGITNGIGDAAFGPHAACTRAQMVTFLWRAAGCPEPSVMETAFGDVDKTSYYYKALLWAVESGITGGTSAVTFSPDAVCSRGQMAAFLYRNAKAPAVSGSHGFADVKADAYYNDAVIWAAAKDITKGTGAAAFSPDAACTRAQMVTFLYRYLAK